MRIKRDKKAIRPINPKRHQNNAGFMQVVLDHGSDLVSLIYTRIGQHFAPPGRVYYNFQQIVRFGKIFEKYSESCKQKSENHI